MADTIGKCVNFGECDNANDGIRLAIPEGAEFVCPGPDCGKELRPADTETRRKLFLVLGAIGLGVVLSIGIVWALIGGDPHPPPPTPKPTPISTPTPDTAQLPCQGEVQKNVLANIMKRGYLIMGAQYYAQPMNYSEDSVDISGDPLPPVEEEERRKKELEANWKREGFDYELATMIAERIPLFGPKKVRVREVGPFTDLFPLLNRKESDGRFSVDISMSGIVRDKNYDNCISWSKGYLSFGYALIAKKGSDINGLEYCQGKRIGIIKGDSIVKAYVQEKLPNAQIVEFDDTQNEWLSNGLNGGQADAVIYDYPFGCSEVKNINEQILQDVKGKRLEIKVARLPDSEREYAIAVPKGNEDLLEVVNDAIDQIKDSPRYVALNRKYLTGCDVLQPSRGPNSYTVRAGDTLSAIALRRLGDASEEQLSKIMALNPQIPNKDTIVRGWTLNLPERSNP